MTREQIIKQILEKQSYLCVGLDTDKDKIPKHLLSSEDPVFEFNKGIIDATQEYCIAYKINLAFYEQDGGKGWESLEKTIQYIPEDLFTIADAKRGDIGNSSEKYAKAFFETLNFDAVTIAPYMGEDSVKRLLQYPGKWTILLALTSNRGSWDFQLLEVGGEQLFENVIKQATKWGTPDNLMFVTGASHPESLELIRKIIPDHFLLVPGIGAQGGSLSEVSEMGMNKQCGLLVNSSRSIIYASDKEDFASQAAERAKDYQQKMRQLLPLI